MSITFGTISEYRNIRLRMYNGKYSGTRYWLDSLIVIPVGEAVQTESRFLWSENKEELQAQYDKDVRRQKRIERKG